MKLTKLLFLLAIIFLFETVSSLKTKKRSKKSKKNFRSHARKDKVSVFRNSYYNICFVHDDCSSSSSSCYNNCDNMRISVDYTYNCSKDKKSSLKSTAQLGRSEKISETSDLPLELKKQIMEHSECADHYFPFVEKFYGRKITSPNPMRIRVMNGFFREQLGLNYYEMAEDVLQSAAIGKDLDFGFAVEQLNLSHQLMANSISSGLPNPLKVGFPALIDDLIDGDLKIERANSYLSKMFLPGIYHEILYVCARGKNSAYHFTFDRAARDPTHERLNSFDLFKRIFQVFSKMWRTLIRVIYYDKTSTCDDKHTPDRFLFSPNMNIVARGENNTIKDYIKYFDDPTIKFIPKGSLMKPVSAEKSSFKKLYVALQRYALRYKKYKPWTENCQHFANGFYNYLTDSSIPFVNHKEMGKVDPEPFSHLFTDESDPEYLENVKVRRAKAKTSDK